jgi:hypothetical protein
MVDHECLLGDGAFAETPGYNGGIVNGGVFQLPDLAEKDGGIGKGGASGKNFIDYPGNAGLFFSRRPGSFLGFLVFHE